MQDTQKPQLLTEEEFATVTHIIKQSYDLHPYLVEYLHDRTVVGSTKKISGDYDNTAQAMYSFLCKAFEGTSSRAATTIKEAYREIGRMNESDTLGR